MRESCVIVCVAVRFVRALAVRILVCVCARTHVQTSCLRERGRLRALTDACARHERVCAHECVRLHLTMQIVIFIIENGLDFQPEKWDQFWARKLGYANLASQDINVRAPRPLG